MGRFEEFLRSMDVDGNGVLEPSEIPEHRRRIYGFLASRAGISTTEPVEISRVLEIAASRFGGPGSPPPGPPTQPPPNPPPASTNDPPKDGEEGEKQSDPATAAPPLVPGFGVEQTLAPVPGFGEPLAMVPVGPSGSLSSSVTSASPTGSNTAGVDPRARGFAEGILRRYDQNQNGVLDRDEWGQMRSDPSAADRNRDGQINLEELATWLVERGASRYGDRRSDSDQAASGPSSSSPSSSAEAASRKSFRFLTPKERLPDGLPDWFTSRDANGDGQVAMAEYASSWTDEKAREFDRFDLNRDGLITPQECLRADSAESETASSSAPSERSGDGNKSKAWWMTP